MVIHQIEHCFAKAARPAREQLEHDRARVSDVRVGRFLSYLKEHLFATSFSVRTSLRSLQLRDNNLSTTFRTQLGEAPRAYVNRLRFETAARLLCEGLPVWQAGQLIGFETIGGFSSGFRRYSRVTPGRFRALATKVSKTAVQGQAGREDIETAMGDGLSATSRRILLRWLAETFPKNRSLKQLSGQGAQAATGTIGALSESSSSDSLSIPLDLLTDRIALELPAVRLLWEEVRDLPFDKQVKLLRQRADFKSPALFLHLREASRIAARDDRAKGLQLARLALVSVRLLELLKLEAHESEIQVQAWAWLGHLHTLCLDFKKAEQAFSTAELYLPRTDCQSLVEGDFCFLKAVCQWYQRKFDQALTLVERAAELFSEDNLFRLHCEAIIFRAMVLFCLERPQESVEDLEQALRLLDPITSPMQCLSAHHEITRCFLVMDNHERATVHLAEARKLNQRLKSRYYDATLEWLEGLMALHGDDLEEAEKHLVQARHGYTEIHHPEHTAALAIDLAVVFARRGALDKAALMATEAVPLLQRLESVDDREKVQRDLRFIRGAIGRVDFDSAPLEQLRARLQRILQTHPAFVLDDHQQRKT